VRQIHKLQMLMRMAEITKLEEYVKCSRRYDAVREEKLGLLTYNLASAESNMAPETDEATRKRLAVRPAPPSAQELAASRWACSCRSSKGVGRAQPVEGTAG
jgi:hypothetical protein